MLKKNTSVSISSDRINGIVKLSKTEYTKKIIFQTVDYTCNDFNGVFSPMAATEESNSYLVFKNDLRMDMRDINTLIEELTEIRDQMIALDVANKLDPS